MSEKIKELRRNTEDAMRFFEKNLAYTLGPVELKEMLAENKVKLLDVRAKEDYDISHLPNAENIPYDKLDEKMENLSKEDIHVVYCYNYLCHLGDRVAYKMAKSGYPVMLLQGGFKSWVEDFHFAVVS